MARLPSRRFRARYTGPDTRLHNAHHTFDTHEDAEAWLTDERRLISSGTWTSPTEREAAAHRHVAEREARTFATYAEAWLSGRHDLRGTTRASYRTALTRHLLPTFGPLPLDAINTAGVRAWFAAYGNRTPTARAHAYALLRGILAQAVDDELITRNPARIRAGGRAPARREPEVLTLSELFGLADAMPEKHRTLTLLAGLCGLRFGECAALTRRDIDLDGGVLTVRLGVVRVNGTKVVGPPKSSASVRRVAMPAVVVDALRSHLRGQVTAGRDALVFPGGDGAPLAPSALYGRAERVERRHGRTFKKSAYGFYAAREAVGHPDLHWHDLRRTAATLGAQSGATVREMQSRLGHATPAMALHYQGATAERDKAIADRLQATVDAHLGTTEVVPILASAARPANSAS